MRKPSDVADMMDSHSNYWKRIMIGSCMKAGYFAQYPTVDSAMGLDLGLVTATYCAAENSKAWSNLIDFNKPFINHEDIPPK